DRVLPPPVWATGTPEASAPASVVPGGRPDTLPRAPDASPGTGLIGDSAPLPADPADPARDDPPPDEPAPEDPGDPAPEDPGDPAPEDPGDPGEVGPDAVPDSPDLPDGAGLIPDEPASDSIFGSPTDVFSN
ncbi:hypothetical protein ABZ322_41960, partial [Streptomyces sp. NPDC006129]